MRGLPFRVTESDIAEVHMRYENYSILWNSATQFAFLLQWFSSVADPVDIIIRYNNQGKPTGEADVAFAK